jgi:methionyl-tRNA formyltransferase
MRLVFLGTPQFAVPTLERVLGAGHELLAVYTQPDRPKGRDHGLAASPVKQAALRRGLAVRQPERIKQPEVIAELAALRPEAMVVVGYGQIIPRSIIEIPPYGIVNVHASLLPRYRGAAPVQWSIASGESATGVTTMRIDAGLDTGDILLAAETPIGPEETAVELAERLARLGADLLVETLDGLRAGNIQPRRQDHALATHAPILRKEHGRIDWNLTAREVYNRVRGFVPWPGAYTGFRGQRLHIWKACLAQALEAATPGLLRPAGRRLLAGCGDGAWLELIEVQLEGKNKVPADAFMNGQHLKQNETLGEMQK